MECSGQRLHFLIFFSPFSNMRGKFLASLCLLNIGAFVYFVCRTDICAISIPRITNTSCTYCIRMKEERMKEKRKKSGMIVFNSQLPKKKNHNNETFHHAICKVSSVRLVQRFACFVNFSFFPRSGSRQKKGDVRPKHSISFVSFISVRFARS